MPTWISLNNFVQLLVAVMLLKFIFGPIFKRSAHATIESLTIDGTILFESKRTSPFQRWTEALNELSNRSRLPKALILRINSPGGTVGASQEIYAILQKLRARGVKIVALLEDVAASGGLYIAMAADKIVSNPGAVTGSIGVIIQGIEYSKVLEWLQIKMRTIKSGAFKDMLSPTREMSTEEQKLLEDVVGDTHEQFMSVVAHGRNLPIETVREFADGRIFNGAQAQVLGVVDTLGGFDAAVSVAETLSGIPIGKGRVGILDNSSSFADSLTDRLSSLNSRFGGLLPAASTLPRGVPLWHMPSM